ncbi:SNF2-related protein [Brachybacterium huguangmaarense]
MPPYRLHLVVDDDLGAALWAREQTAPGRSRALDDLAPLVGQAPESLARVLAPRTGRLRHRVPVGPDGRRVPAVGLSGGELLALVDALRTVLDPPDRAAGAPPLVERLAPHVEAGRSVSLAPQLAAMPDLLQALLVDDAARTLVAARQVLPVLVERFDRVWAQWRPVGLDGAPYDTPLLSQLVDTRARRALRDVLDGSAGAAAVPGATSDGDPRRVLASLLDDAVDVDADLPLTRSMTRAVEAFARSAKATVQLASTELALVVRLHEPPVGTAWPLQTCLREPDGTVHPVADLRAVGDLTAAGAIEAAGEILRLAPTVRDAAWDDTGVDWLLTTAEASRFLVEDADLLEAAGVVVMLPREWTRVRAALRPEAVDAPEEKRGSGVGLQAMASFRFRLAIGDVELTDDEIAGIREAQGELVRLRGQWVRLDTGTLRAAERFLDAFEARARRRARETDPDAPRLLEAAPRDRTAPPARSAGASAASGFALRDAEELRVGALGSGGSDAAAHGALFGPTGDLTLRDWFTLLASADAASTVVEGASVSGRMAELLDVHEKAGALPAPSTLRARLRPYQQRGLDWMWFLDVHGVGGILADDMGLGKTMQVLALLCRERELAEDPDRLGPTLLVCPMSVVGSWQREAAAFAPHLRVHVHHGGDRVRDASFVEGARDVDLVLTTYSLLARDLPLLQSVPWHRVVLDEAQHVKNPQTAVARAARSLPEGRRLALTGTPVENRLADLHALMEVVNPGLLGPLATFQDAIAGPIESDADESAISRMTSLTSPFILRRVKTDRTIIQDLPAKTEITQTVNLTPEQAGLYEAIVHEMMTEIDGAGESRRRAVVGATLTRLKQVCNHPAHYLGDGSGILRDGAHRSGKLELVDDLLEAAFAEGEKVLLFTQFTTFGHMLVPYWTQKFGLDLPFLHGGVPKPERDAMVARFQERTDEPGAMLLSLRAGGTGLTLTAANHVVHLDRWWNPAVENQATDRAFRIGQRKDVQVRKLVSAGTVEERIDVVLADKSHLASLAVASGEGWIASLGDDELASLLALDPDQVGGIPEPRAEDRGRADRWEGGR